MHDCSTRVSGYSLFRGDREVKKKRCWGSILLCVGVVVSAEMWGSLGGSMHGGNLMRERNLGDMRGKSHAAIEGLCHRPL